MVALDLEVKWSGEDKGASGKEHETDKLVNFP